MTTAKITMNKWEWWWMESLPRFDMATSSAEEEDEDEDEDEGEREP